MTDLYSSLVINPWLIGPELALLLASFVVMLSVWVRGNNQISFIVTLLGLVTAIGLSVRQWGIPESGFSGMVTVDNFGVMFKLICASGSLLALLLGYKYMKERLLEKPEYYALLLVSTIGMMVMANSTDLVVIFLGLEIMSVPLYVMAAFNRRSLESNESGIKYFIIGSFASAFLLMGIALVFGAAETTNLKTILANTNYILNNRGLYLLVGSALIFVGFAFKIGAVPFHSWVPDVYQGAPTPVTAFFSVAPKAAGIAALLRIFSYGLAELHALESVFWIVAVLTMTVGNILALRQSNVKRMLAYSSIAHAGYMLVAVTAGGSGAVSAAVLYMVAYALFNLGAFSILTALETRAGMKLEFSDFVGLSKSNPYLAAILSLFMLALAGFPPTVGFFGKYYIFSAAIKSNLIWLTVIGVLNSFVSVYYYLRVIKASYFDEATSESTAIRLSPSLLFVLFVATVGTIGLGILPQQLLELSQKAIFALM